MDDVTKLPKWAQTRIQVAEMRQREAEDKVSSLLGEHEGPVLLRLGNGDYVLPSSTGIRFSLPDNHWIDVRLDRVKCDHIDIYTDADMVIRPGANNHINVYARYE